MQVPPLHTADEMQRISNLAHAVEGAVLAFAALVVLLQASDLMNRGRARYLWPGLVFLAGVFLLGYLLIPHHGREHARAQWEFVFGDPQQRQHIVVAVLATAGGLAELLYRTGRLEQWWWQLVWPAVVVTVGLMFGLHTQHGTDEAVRRAVLIHRWLGLFLIAAGALRAVEVLPGARTRWLAYAWGSALLAAAALLIAYREPPGAYHGQSGTAGAGHRAAEAGRPRAEAVAEPPATEGADRKRAPAPPPR